MTVRTRPLAAAAFIALCAATAKPHATETLRGREKSAVDGAIRPLMNQYHIPGMAVGVIDGGRVIRRSRIDSIEVMQ